MNSCLFEPLVIWTKKNTSLKDWKNQWTVSIQTPTTSFIQTQFHSSRIQQEEKSERNIQRPRGEATRLRSNWTKSKDIPRNQSLNVFLIEEERNIPRKSTASATRSSATRPPKTDERRFTRDDIVASRIDIKRDRLRPTAEKWQEFSGPDIPSNKSWRIFTAVGTCQTEGKKPEV